ncbi:hypothetical protein [Streptomyces kanamyceticus]|uniref:hypothetical protein n=1 Tax=Streptomyces kanamyceticus TaxID=1967 RepID=UPI0037DDCDF1
MAALTHGLAPGAKRAAGTPETGTAAARTPGRRPAERAQTGSIASAAHLVTPLPAL